MVKNLLNGFGKSYAGLGKASRNGYGQGNLCLQTTQHI